MSKEAIRKVDKTCGKSFISGGSGKVIHPKHYKNSKKGAHQSHLGSKNGLVSGRLACTSSETEILNKIGM